MDDQEMWFNSWIKGTKSKKEKRKSHYINRNINIEPAEDGLEFVIFGGLITPSIPSFYFLHEHYMNTCIH